MFSNEKLNTFPGSSRKIPKLDAKTKGSYIKLGDNTITDDGPMLSLRAEEKWALLTSSLAKTKVMQEHFLQQCSKGSPGAYLLRVPPEGHLGSARST